MDGSLNMGSESAADIPAELRGHEVSGRAFVALFEAGVRKGFSPTDLARGTGYSSDELRDPRQRIAWSAFMTFAQNLGRGMSEDQLVAMGATLLDNPVHRAFLVSGRVLFSLPDIYRWGVKPDGPLAQLLIPIDMTLTQLDERRLVVVSTMKPGYTSVREFWLLRMGFLRSVSRAFGLPESEVKLTETKTRATFEVTLPADTGILSRIRTKTSWVFAARDAADSLREANANLHARYAELQREVLARRAAEENLQRLNAELEQRVLARTGELSTANRELADANEQLSLFNAAVAHDLRAPLRSVRGFAKALLDDYGQSLEPDAQSQLGRVVSGAERMSSLVDALLALSRVGRLDMQRCKVDLGDMARGVLDDLRAAEPDHHVEVSIDPDMSVDGDPVLVRALLENLLGNAWKFTRNRRPARIEISRAASSPVDVFQVRDNGVGFEMKNAGTVFAPFRRLHSASDFEGTGMGLAIVDRIVRRHGGKIWVEAKRDDGAAFSFTLSAGRPLSV